MNLRIAEMIYLTVARRFLSAIRHRRIQSNSSMVTVRDQPFERIAGRYRSLNRILSFGLDRNWRRRAVAELALTGKQKLLDVGTGPGDVLAAVRTPGVVKIGLDPEPQMMAESDGRCFCGVLGAAETLPFLDGSVDRIASAFAVRNFSDRHRAFGEFNRVLVPGGRGAVLEFSPPQDGLPGSVAALYVRVLIPFIGGWISGDPDAYSYLARTIMAFPSPGEIVAELKSAGFENVIAQRLIGGVTVLYTFDRPDA